MPYGAVAMPLLGVWPQVKLLVELREGGGCGQITVPRYNIVFDGGKKKLSGYTFFTFLFFIHQTIRVLVLTSEI